MTLRHHPSDETLLAFAAGTLDLGQRLVVASHVERCEACRGAVRAAEHVAGEMLSHLPPTPMAAEALAHVLARIETRAAAPSKPIVMNDMPGLPASLRAYELGRWRWLGPGVSMRPIVLPTASDIHVFLLKGAPGTRLPQHSHTGSELTAILHGSYAHAGGRYAAGDFEEADEDIEHRPIVGPESECLCLVALQGQLRLSGVIGALLNPFVRL